MNRPKEFLQWAVAMFGGVALERRERLDRFMEEAIELAHADGMDGLRLQRIIDRVYSRSRGEVSKEIGQAQACLETYAENIGLSSDYLAGKEFERVRAIPQEEWARRHEAKVKLGIAS